MSSFLGGGAKKKSSDETKFGVSDEEMEALRAQIAESAELSDDEKSQNKRILPMLFWLGNQLREAGCDEDWIRPRVKSVGTSLKFNLIDPWKTVRNRRETLLKQHAEGK